MTSVSAFFPTYNERENIEATVQEADVALEEVADDYEIIIVDDGSSDGTAEIADRLARENPRVRVVHHPCNRGYGGAMQSGIAASTKDLIFYTDADGQFDIKEVSLLLPLIEDADIVAGYRQNRQDPRMRVFVAGVYNLMMRVLLGLRIRDVDCAFKMYRREVFDHITVRAETGLADTEIIIKAQNLGMRIKQVAVSHRPRRAGKTSYEHGKRGIFAVVKPKTVWDILKEMRRLWRELRGGVTRAGSVTDAAGNVGLADRASGE